MTSPKASTRKTNIRRKRTGCLTCRERRVRCDEQKPTCRNCSRKQRNCTWARDGDKFRHHSFSQPTPSVPARLSPSQPLDETASVPAKAAIVNEDVSPKSRPAIEVSPSNAGSGLLSPRLSSGSVGEEDEDNSSQQYHEAVPVIARNDSNALSTHTTSTTDLTATEVRHWQKEILGSYQGDDATSARNRASSICRSQSARLKDTIDIEHESSTPPNLEPNAEVFTDWRTVGASDFVVEALNGDREFGLLQYYLQQCAPWFDALDSKRNYSRRNVARMMTCPPWRAAALAISAKHSELSSSKHQTPESLSLHLYQLAVQAAIDSIGGRFDCIGTTAGCVILAVYEMMTVTWKDWRRHLRGCTSIYSHNEWNGDSSGLIRASFWNYARIDVWAAFCAKSETMLPTDSWFDHPDALMNLPCSDDDRLAHICVWLLARVNNLMHRTTPISPLSMTNEVSKLKKDLSKWEDLCQATMKPIMQLTPLSSWDNPFPQVLFASETAAIAHLIWHTATVLLISIDQSSTAREDQSLAYEHARLVCGIVETHKSCSSLLVEAIHPLFICGNVLVTKAEKFAILELLAHIERVTAWNTTWRSDSLREIWRLS